MSTGLVFHNDSYFCTHHTKILKDFYNNFMRNHRFMGPHRVPETEEKKERWGHTL